MSCHRILIPVWFLLYVFRQKIIMESKSWEASRGLGLLWIYQVAFDQLLAQCQGQAQAPSITPISYSHRGVISWEFRWRNLPSEVQLILLSEDDAQPQQCVSLGWLQISSFSQYSVFSAKEQCPQLKCKRKQDPVHRLKMSLQRCLEIRP